MNLEVGDTVLLKWRGNVEAIVKEIDPNKLPLIGVSLNNETRLIPHMDLTKKVIEVLE